MEMLRFKSVKQAVIKQNIQKYVCASIPNYQNSMILQKEL
jgi:hypothetical protein